MDMLIGIQNPSIARSPETVKSRQTYQALESMQPPIQTDDRSPFMNDIMTTKAIVGQGNSVPVEQHEDYFEDQIEKFVQMMKLLTQAVEINIYTSDLLQLYKDVSAQVSNPFTEEERQGILDKLVDFKLDIAMKQNEKSNLNRTEESLNNTQSMEPKTLIRDSRYRIPPETTFKRYKSKPSEGTQQSRFLAADD